LDPNTHITLLIKLLKGGGELIFGDTLRDPYQANLKAILGQREASQL
jgi:hypothetical protein